MQESQERLLINLAHKESLDPRLNYGLLNLEAAHSIGVEHWLGIHQETLFSWRCPILLSFQSPVGDGSGRHRSEEHQVVTALDASHFPLNFLADDAEILKSSPAFSLPARKHAQTSYPTWSLCVAVAHCLC